MNRNSFLALVLMGTIFVALRCSKKKASLVGSKEAVSILFILHTRLFLACHLCLKQTVLRPQGKLHHLLLGIGNVSPVHGLLDLGENLLPFQGGEGVLVRRLC